MKPCLRAVSKPSHKALCCSKPPKASQWQLVTRVPGGNPRKVRAKVKVGLARLTGLCEAPAGVDALPLSLEIPLL
jgi:hypothetical protein